MIAGNRFAKLLQGPGCRWMPGDVAMHDAPRPDLHEEEHIESSEPGGHHDQEIASDEGPGMIADKRPPVLRRGSPVAPSLRFGRPIGAHCAWRNFDTKLHRQFRCHTRLSPSRILLCHLHDEFADVLMFSGIRGRPACDFHFQNNLKPLRCQPIRVSGLTMTKASFQSQRRDQRIREKRAESFNRLGWTCLSS
jgi:hypothetical protein